MPDESPVVRIGEWRVDPDLDELSREGQTIRVEPRTMQLLLYLAAHAGRVVDVRQLLDEVWSNVVVTQGSVYQAIAQLRRLLGDDSEHPKYIENLPRRGYRLIAPVARWDTPSAAEAVATRGTQGLDRMPACAVPAELQLASAGRDPSATTIAEGGAAPTAVSTGRSRRSAVLGAITLVLIITGIAFGVVWRTRHLQVTGAGTEGKTEVTVSAVTPSIAVLPFLDLTEKHDQEYFADGMAEEMLDLLVKVPGLRVISRTSSFQFKGKGEDLHSIAAKLGVGFVVEGSVRKSGDAIRVSSQLIRVEDGTHLWSETYNRNVGDALQVQSEIAHSIARALELTITDTSAISGAPLHNVEAYNVYLKGRHAVDRYDQTGLEEGVADFEQALKLDPTFAPAAAWLAFTLNTQVEENFIPSTGMEKAREAAQQALRLDPKSGLAHALLGEIHLWYDWDWGAADRELKLALALEPHNEWPLNIASFLAAAFGRWDEALHYTNEAISVSPLSSAEWSTLGLWLLDSGRLDDAEAAFRKALEISPTFAGGHSWLSEVYLLRGQLEAARIEAEHDESAVCLAFVYHALGRHADSDRMLARALAEQGEGAALSIAGAHAFRGEPDAAFDWLERAYRRRAIGLHLFKADPFFKTLERDPRYDEFLRKMNLPK